MKVVLPSEFEGHWALPTLREQFPNVEFLVDEHCPKGKAYILNPAYFNPDPFDFTFEWVQPTPEDEIMTAKLQWVGDLIITEKPRKGKFTSHD